MAKKRSQTVQAKLDFAYARLAAAAVGRAMEMVKQDRFRDADNAMDWATNWADRAGANAVRWVL